MFLVLSAAVFSWSPTAWQVRAGVQTAAGEGSEGQEQIQGPRDSAVLLYGGRHAGSGARGER